MFLYELFKVKKSVPAFILGNSTGITLRGSDIAFSGEVIFRYIDGCVLALIKLKMPEDKFGYNLTLVCEDHHLIVKQDGVAITYADKIDGVEELELIPLIGSCLEISDSVMATVPTEGTMAFIDEFGAKVQEAFYCIVTEEFNDVGKKNSVYIGIKEEDYDKSMDVKFSAELDLFLHKAGKGRIGYCNLFNISDGTSDKPKSFPPEYEEDELKEEGGRTNDPSVNFYLKKRFSLPMGFSFSLFSNKSFRLNDVYVEIKPTCRSSAEVSLGFATFEELGKFKPNNLKLVGNLLIIKFNNGVEYSGSIVEGFQDFGSSVAPMPHMHTPRPMGLHGHVAYEHHEAPQQWHLGKPTYRY